MADRGKGGKGLGKGGAKHHRKVLRDNIQGIAKPTICRLACHRGVMTQILKDMGIAEYEPRVINQMLEFTYRYVTTIIEDAKIYSTHAKKSNVDADDVRLAIQCRMDQSFTSPPPRDFLLEVARQKNQTPLPLIKPYTGPRLPPDRYCLTAPNYRLKSLQKKNHCTSSAGRITVPRLSVGAMSSRPSTPTLEAQTPLRGGEMVTAEAVPLEGTLTRPPSPGELPFTASRSDVSDPVTSIGQATAESSLLPLPHVSRREEFRVLMQRAAAGAQEMGKVVETERVVLLDAPITPGQTFGATIDVSLQRSHKATEVASRFSHLLAYRQRPRWHSQPARAKGTEHRPPPQSRQARTPVSQSVTLTTKVGTPVSLSGQRFTVQIPSSQSSTVKSAMPSTPTVQNVLINPSLIGSKNILITTNMVSSQSSANESNALKRKHEDEDDYDTL
ncbi:TAF9 factor, partial [Polyodon spathula]|nr:TAF9 factor [Polyodon spathula]